MAIHPSIPGITVSIFNSKSRPLKEYPTPNDPFKHEDPTITAHHSKCTTTNYIESKTGDSFAVRLTANEQYKFTSAGLTFEVAVDGNLIDVRLLEQEDFFDGRWKFTVKGPIVKTNDGSAIKTMLFSDIAETAGEIKNAEMQKQKDLLKDVGEIVVTAYRVSESEETAIENFAKDPVDSTTEFHTKALIKDPKSHLVSFGDETPIDGYELFDPERIDGDDFPLVVYEFKYRSKETLEELEVIPKVDIPIKARSTETPTPRGAAPSANTPQVQALPCDPEAPVDPLISRLLQPLPVESVIAAPGLNLKEFASLPAEKQQQHITRSVQRIQRPSGPDSEPFYYLDTTPSPTPTTAMNHPTHSNFNSDTSQCSTNVPPPVKTEPSIHTPADLPVPIGVKREKPEDGQDSRPGRRKKPKKMAGKMIIDLTEEDDADVEVIEVE